jgi:hypothetical protein
MPKDCQKLSFYDIKIAEIASQIIAMTWKFEDPTILRKAS